MSFFRAPAATESPAPASAGPELHGYQRRLERAAERSHQGVLARQEIGSLPPVADPERRARCKASLAEHAKTYFAGTFRDPWAQYHLDLIAHFEQIIRQGGHRVVAIERGGGKTALCLAACSWALLNGYRHYGVFVGDTATMGKALQTKLIDMCRTSETLVADYPELIVFVKATDNRKKLRSQGQPIRFTLENADGQTIFPDFEQCESCQAVISSTGMTGSGGRGNSFVNMRGEMIRPDLLLLDDCQNDESARSGSQTLHREEKIENSFMGMAGGDVRIAAIMPITVQTEDCLASRYLDRHRHGDWHGMRYEAVPSMPKRMDLWDKFGELLRMGDTPDQGELLARDWFRDHFEEMLQDAVVSWSSRCTPGDLHPLEKYMRLYYLRPDYFNAEIQQRGKRKSQIERLTRELLQTRLSGYTMGTVPDEAAHLVGFVDTHLELLYWAVCAVATDLTTWVVDYGTWPEQATRLFTLRGASRQISNSDAYKGLPEDESLIAAHLDLDRHLIGRPWRRKSGHEIPLARVGKDVGYKQDLVNKAIALSPYREKMRASLGRTVPAGRERIHQWKVLTRGVDDHTGPDWIQRYQKDTGQMRTTFDANRWKSTLAQGLCTTPGAPGSVTFFGHRPQDHQLIFDHCLAETRKPETKGGETIEIWTNPPSHPDNHWWDCLVGCQVAASQLGALAAGQQTHDITPPRRDVEIPSWMLGGGRL